MIDDFVSPGRRKPKRIEPLPRPDKQLPAFDEAVKTHEQQTDDVPGMTSEAIPLDEWNGTPTSLSEPANEAPEHPEATKPPEEKPKKARQLKFSRPYSKRQKVLGSIAAILFAFGVGAAWTHIHHLPSVKADVAKTRIKKAAPPKPIYSTLTGLPVSDASVNLRPVTGVMIENSIDARPQSGLDQAGVVFEAIAEGGITRFLALFQDTQPDYIGPVRSARPYYVQWCISFDCSYAHVGGSPEALTDIKQWGVKDLDQFANSGAYQRISSRYAPHNVYTSTAQLNQLEANKGFGASTYTGFIRKPDQAYKAPAQATSAKPATTRQDMRTPATSIDFAISSMYFNTHYDYHPTTNSYSRSEGGAAHMELHKDGSQVQITPKVVIAMVMQYGLEADDHHSQYNVIGSGQAFIFQDGTVTPATWSKPDDKSQISFVDASGAPIKLNAGQTWITALSAAGQATYK